MARPGSDPHSLLLCPFAFAGVSQLVESQLPKLDVVGSIPIARSVSRETDKDLVLPVYRGVVAKHMLCYTGAMV